MHLFNKKDLCILHLPTCNLPHVAVAVAVAVAVTVAVAVAADAANCLPQQLKATFVDVMKWTQLPMQEILCICRLSAGEWGKRVRLQLETVLRASLSALGTLIK